MIESTIKQSKEELLDCIHNLMGVFNSPIAKKRIAGSFADEAMQIADDILKSNGRTLYKGESLCSLLTQTMDPT